MDHVLSDFNGADSYYSRAGAPEWRELETLITEMPIYLQASDQRSKQGNPIFDPKASNAYLNAKARKLGWRVVPVPPLLTEFGTDWDAGKGGTLVEWQFSNYPFLWNNIIRSEAVFKSNMQLTGVESFQALVILAKCAAFPSSNSTLYFEQARAQIDRVTRFGAFSVPIRLVGLTIPPGAATVDVIWSQYADRYSRAAVHQLPRQVAVTWKRKPAKHDAVRTVLELVDHH
jgi:hypothetical protein